LNNLKIGSRKRALEIFRDPVFKDFKGFTLIEILVAVLILGIVLSTVYASYTGTFRIIGEIQYDAEVYSMARSTLDRMARDLQSAALWRGAFTFKTKSYSLGNREFMRLTFRSAAHIAFSDKDAPDGISVIEYSVEEGKEGYTLSRNDSLYRDPEKESSPSDGFLLCKRVEALTYTFYDESGKEHESWDSGTTVVEMQKKRVPAAVLIRLSMISETDPKRPHLFITRVRLPFNRPEAP
jgi:general secretion pathway protein J